MKRTTFPSLRSGAWLALPLLFFAAAAWGGELVNKDADGLALKGYDPVSYFKGDKPMMGMAEYESEYHGATYRFVSAEHKEMFDQDPAKYAPQFGGYCGYGVSVGKLLDIDPMAYAVVDGRLILQNSQKVADLFLEDAEGNLAKADEMWPGVMKERMMEKEEMMKKEKMKKME